MARSGKGLIYHPLQISIIAARVCQRAVGNGCWQMLQPQRIGQLGDVALGSAVELSSAVITPLGAYRGRLELNSFENAVFLWESAQQHACTTYQALLQTPFIVPALGRVQRALTAL